MWEEIANTHARGGVGRRQPRARIVYRPTPGGMIALDAEIEKALRESGAEVTRGSAVDAVEPQDLIAITKAAASEANIAAAFDAAARYSRHVSAVILAIDTPRSFKIPHANEITALSGLGSIALYRIDRDDFDPWALLQRELVEYFAWSRSGRKLESRPTFFKERPRARENFLALVKRAPATSEDARAFAVAIARDLFDVGPAMDRAIAALIEAFATREPRDLLSSAVAAEAAADSSDDASTIFSDRSSLGLGDEPWNDEEPEAEERPSRSLVDRFDTPMPLGVEYAPRVNYYEVEERVEESVDPITLVASRREVVEKCRAVSEDSLRALVDLDPSNWKGASVGGIPLVSEAAIARYEADPSATGTEIDGVEDGGIVRDRVILDQSRHWSGKFGYAPAALEYPVPASVRGAFANVEIIGETAGLGFGGSGAGADPAAPAEGKPGEILLVRTVRAGEFLTFDYGAEFFGENAHPRLFLENVAKKPRDPDTLENLIDVMMSHAWSAERAEALELVEAFARSAAQTLLVDEMNLSSLPFWICAVSDSPREREARARVAAAIESAEADLAREFSESGEESAVAEMLAEIARRAIESDDPVALWNAAKREWAEMNAHLETLESTDVVLHAQMRMVMDLIDEEDARVMRPGRVRFGNIEELRLGVDYVMPYTAIAVRRAAEEMKREMLETWKKLFRDAGVDPEKTVSWEEARAMAAEREDLMSRMAEADRANMRDFVNFWLGYNEFTVADPDDPSKRELVHSVAEMLEVRATEIAQAETERERETEKLAKMREAEDREFEAAEERARVRKEQAASREARREAERAEFDRLGTALMTRRDPADASAFDLMDRDTVLHLIRVLEKSYGKLFESFKKPESDRWRRWKDLANSAYVSAPGGGWATTAKHPKFVGDAVRVLGEFEAYERREHPKKYRKALEAAGLATPKRKKARKARISNPVSPAKPSVSPALAISPASPRVEASAAKSYPPADVFGAAANMIRRARGDAVFFFYNTRGEGLVEQFRAIFQDAEVLHRPEPGGGGAGGAASPDDVLAKVTHFFVLYGGDVDAPRWYEQVTRGIAGWPYLIATRESRDLVDPKAEMIAGSEFDMGGEKFAAWRRAAEVIVLSD